MCCCFKVDEEEEDSFVVDNSFVEYETEYVGDAMLAEDPIINQVRWRGGGGGGLLTR